MSVPLFWLGGQVMAALFVAAIVIHTALVASHVANQTLALTTTDAPATANSAHVVAGFAGGATASALAASPTPTSAGPAWSRSRGCGCWWAGGVRRSGGASRRAAV